MEGTYLELLFISLSTALIEPRDLNTRMNIRNCCLSFNDASSSFLSKLGGPQRQSSMCKT